jgi:hypothetical protein
MHHAAGTGGVAGARECGVNAALTAMAAYRRVVHSSCWSSVASGCCSIDAASRHDCRQEVADRCAAACTVLPTPANRLLLLTAAMPRYTWQAFSAHCRVSLSASTRSCLCVSEATLITAVQLQQREQLHMTHTALQRYGVVSCSLRSCTSCFSSSLCSSCCSCCCSCCCVCAVACRVRCLAHPPPRPM